MKVLSVSKELASALQHTVSPGKVSVRTLEIGPRRLKKHNEGLAYSNERRKPHLFRLDDHSPVSEARREAILYRLSNVARPRSEGDGRLGAREVVGSGDLCANTIGERQNDFS